MSKKTSGVMLIVGLIVALVSIVIAISPNGKKDHSELDGYYDALQYFVVGTAIIGLGLFLWGSMNFARK